MYQSDAVLGILIIVGSMLTGFVFCISICLVLWLRYKDGSVPTLWSRLLFHQKSVPSHFGSPVEASIDEILVLPTIPHSEPGSEPGSLNYAHSSSTPLNPYDKRNFQTFPGYSITSPPTESPARLPESARKRLLSRDPSTMSSHLDSRQRRPSSLKLVPSASSTVSSESGTSTSPADYESLITHFRLSDSSYNSMDEVSPSLRSSTHFGTFPTGIEHRPKDQKQKFKIGTLKINLKYFCDQKIFQLNLLRGYQLPNHINYREEDLYAKFSLVIKGCKIRGSKPLNSQPPDSSNPAIATFEYKTEMQDLAQASVVITLCKKTSTWDQGMVIGCAYVNISDLLLSETKDFDSGSMALPLEDFNPHQMMFCEGFLRFMIEIPLHGTHLNLSNIQLSGMDLSKIFATREDYVQLYLKITLYENGEAVFWRRTSPVKVTPATEVITLASLALLEMIPMQLQNLQLVLSVRMKTGRRGERCILGNIYLGESWFNIEETQKKGDQSYPSKFFFNLPLEY